MRLRIPRITVVLLFVPLVALACRDESTSVPLQISTVERARTEWEREQRRLVNMRDSLEIKVGENLRLGLPPDRARSIETALIQSQEALVKASRLNYDAQADLLEQMRQK